LYFVSVIRFGCLAKKQDDKNPRFRIYRETLSRFSCATSGGMSMYPEEQNVACDNDPRGVR
ncbi:hypothetical protein ABLN85_13485, partial [Mycobacterium tuberculosis]